jgi:outer membrane protein OmpA-like peptidoglycan-associated protein
MKKIRTIAVVLVCLVVVFTITGFFILPPVLTSVVSKNLGKALHRDVTIQRIKVNPYTLVLEVQGLAIKDQVRPGAFVSLGSLTVNVEWLSLFKRAPIVRELKLDKPSIRIIRFEDNTYNFSDLLKGEKKGEKPQSFSVSNIQITGGNVVMEDRPMHKTHTVRDIALTIPFLSNMPHLTDIFVQPSFQAVINGTALVLKGRSKPFAESLESSLTINLKQIDIPYYFAYLPMKPGFAVKSGLLDLNATITFLQFKDKRRPESNSIAQAVCRGLVVTDLDGNTLLTMPSLDVTLARSQLLKRKIHIRKIDISSPELFVSRDRTGTLNLSQVLKKTTPGTDPSATPKAQAGGDPTVLTIDEITLAGGKIAFTDSSGSLPVKITAGDLSVSAQGLSTEKMGGGKVNIACTVNQTGRLSLGASFTLQPVSVDMDVDLDGFQPAWIQPYFIEKFPVLVRRGTLAAKGRVLLARNEGRPLSMAFNGDVRITDFASVDRAKAEDLLSWKDLSITGIEFSLDPGRLAVREIALASPVSSYFINPDGTSNVSSVLGGRKAEPEPLRKSTLERISVGRVSVKNGRFTFTDRSVAPKFTSSLTAVTGSVTGLSTDEFKKAQIKLQAKLDNQAPISITGSINPLKKNLFLDLTASLQNMELSPASPYSGKYAGYAIDKGKLSLNLKYSIDEKELTAQNDVLIDQLTFGDSVESKDATSLPVRLAVALLRDSSGKIDLHLPVTGRTDDPEFHVGKVIIQIIVNLLEKAATSPFALLEALYPGATELSTIEFEPGRSTLTDEGRNRLTELAKILNDRPSLNLEIKGYVDAEGDRAGLVTALFERKLKAIKLKDLIRAGKQASNIDEIIIDPAEYSTYLKKAYKEDSFKKPSNIFGISASLPDDEMKRLIIEHITVGDEDLKGLARERSQKVRDDLAEAGMIEPGRIFLVEADPFTPEQLEQTSNSRVSLTIR